LAIDVAEVLEAMDCGSAHLVGHAFGNRVARCLAVDLPRAGHFLLLERPEAVTRAVAEFVGAGAVSR
jgi:pimeloyl-ACP methyl ester carboxylesterase